MFDDWTATDFLFYGIILGLIVTAIFFSRRRK